MGAPHWQWREFFKQHGVVPFSANFELYGDLSERITNLLASITPSIEVYSVDESFLDLGELDIADYTAWGTTVRDSILKNVGIPVSVGISPSKTLCKVANDRAKKLPELGGVLDLSQQGAITDHYLNSLSIADVWGVGRQLAPKLRADGIHTALSLRTMSPKRAQQIMGIHGRHMVYELNGVACLPLMQDHKSQQMVSRGRQFGEDTNEGYIIESAVTTLSTRAAAILRREHQLASRATVILQTNKYKPGYQQVSREVQFATPTADTGVIASQLVRALSQPYNSRVLFHKAEVLLYDLVADNGLQADLFGTVDMSQHSKSNAKMRAIDAINLKHGPGTIKQASEALSKAWEPRKDLCSRRYTSAWADIPEVRLVDRSF